MTIQKQTPPRTRMITQKQNQNESETNSGTVDAISSAAIAILYDWMRARVTQHFIG